MISFSTAPLSSADAKRRLQPVGCSRTNADDCLQAVRQARALRRARLFEGHGDAKLTDLLLTPADCQNARSANIHDRCKAVYEQLLTQGT